MKRLTALLLLMAMLCSSCADTAREPLETTDAALTDSVTTEATEFVYEFTKEYEGTEFRILNAGDVYSMRAEIDREEITGDHLDDAMFNRCRTLEEEMGITIVEENRHVDAQLANFAMQILLAGEDAYDTMYIPARDLYKFTSDGLLRNLLEYDEFNFDRDWWIASYNEASSVGGELYAAAGYSQLMILDSIWCLFFNETMMDKLMLDYPYDAVRNGSWTLDAMKEYLKVGAQLNGDDSFTWNADGNSIYGVSSGGPGYFIRGAGETYITVKNGELAFSAGTERFYNVVEAVVSLLNADEGYVFRHLGKSDGEPGNYITTFESQRALFLTAELSKTSRMRDKEFEFGIVPFPKYDESQKDYVHSPFYGTPCYTIPITVGNPERSAAIGDALTYLSWDTVLPVFREVTLEQKGLRNDDSIEMLNIIIESSVPNLTTIYGVGSELTTAVGNKINSENPSVASDIATYKSQINEQLNKINK